MRNNCHSPWKGRGRSSGSDGNTEGLGSREQAQREPRKEPRQESGEGSGANTKMKRGLPEEMCQMLSTEGDEASVSGHVCKEGGY